MRLCWICLFSLYFTSCMTPKTIIQKVEPKKPMEWDHKKHETMMYTCKAVCGSIKAYDALTAKCECSEKK